MKIIVRIKGGIGNQLFCYASARRLAMCNNAELVIDDVTGFARDRLYRRHYMLNHFNIQARKATSAERLEPFERYRRGLSKWWSRKKPFGDRRYLEQEGFEFDPRLLSLRVKRDLYLDGLWQSENYFKDVEKTIQEDLRFITPPIDKRNSSMAAEISKTTAVAIHVRWFDAEVSSSTYNVSIEYYKHAIALMEERITSPHYFIFSDDPVNTRNMLSIPIDRVTFVSCNNGDENAYADMWLMSHCKHFIIPRSTFAWWGAWLSTYPDKIVFMPKFTPIGAPDWLSMGMVFERCTQL